MPAAQPLYFLEVVKNGEQPSWSLEDPELISGSQPLDDQYIQYWAYPKTSQTFSRETPPSEILATNHHTDKPALLINQLDSNPPLIELLIVLKGHVWVRSESSIENIEENLAQTLDFAKKRFKMKVEGFMTTDSVTPEVDEKLDQIENPDASEDSDDSPEVTAIPEEKPEPAEKVEKTHNLDSLIGEEMPPAHTLMENDVQEESSVKPASSYGYHPPMYAGGTPSSKSSKKWIIIPLAVIVLAVGGAYLFRDKLTNKLNGLSFLAATSPSPSPSIAAPVVEPTPSPTTAPDVDRSKYTIRVLNGTTKTGGASTLGDKLKTLGWKIERVGNATNSATAQTTIRTKSGLDDVFATLAKDLSPDLKAASGSALKSDDRSDAEVTIGLQ